MKLIAFLFQIMVLLNLAETQQKAGFIFPILCKLALKHLPILTF